KKEYPNNVYKVPVEARHFDRGVVLKTEITAPRGKQQPCHQPEANDHMQSMKARHDEIQVVKDAYLIAKFITVDLSRRWIVIANLFGLSQKSFFFSKLRKRTIRE